MLRFVLHQPTPESDGWMSGWLDGLCVSVTLKFNCTYFYSFRRADIIHNNTEILNLNSNDVGLIFWSSPGETVSQIYKCIQMEAVRPNKDITAIRRLFECVCLPERVSLLFPSGYLYFHGVCIKVTVSSYHENSLDVGTLWSHMVMKILLILMREHCV